jgi:sucrose-6-phosphate hydrolase SacC (GH32 family)
MITIFLISLTSLGLIGCGNKASSNVVLHYGFDETSGEETLESESKSKKHVFYVFNERNAAMLYQTPKDPQWRKNGIVGGALRFDGYSNYIIDESFKMPEDSFTISAWVAPHAFEWGDGGNLSAILSQSNYTYKEGFDFGMYRHGAWGIKMVLGSELTKSAQSYMVGESYYLKPNTWQFIAVTFDQESVNLYYNGILARKVSLGDYSGFPFSSALAAPLLIGKNSAQQKVEAFDVNMFNGLLDELTIRDEALTENDIQKIYQKDLEAHNNEIPVIEDEDIQLQQSWYFEDRNRPQFHAMPNGHWMNEPHAPIYYNGKYHLFYQHNPTGPFWHQIHWGHWVSDDMINWTDVGVAIRPHLGVTPDGVWSGSSILDQNGEPVLFITAGNDATSPNQGVALCRPKDLTDPLLKEWTCEDDLAIKQIQGTGKFGEFRDPYVFKVDDTYFTLVGSGTTNNRGGTSLIYKSTDLDSFQFMGELFVSDFNQYPFLGLQWELPVFLPLKDEFGNDTNKWFYAISPHPVSLSDVEVYYWIGEFNRDTARFTPDHQNPKVLDYGDGAFTGPSGFVDPNTGKSILFTIAQGIGANAWQQYYSGWAHSAGMPVELYYNSVSNALNFKPIEQLSNARSETLVDLDNQTFDQANAVLDGVGGDLLEIILEVDPNDASSFGINVRQSTTEVTSITYNALENKVIYNSVRSSEETIGFQRIAPVTLINGNIRIHILLDRSLVEIYLNNQSSITSRIYPVNSESVGISLFTNGNAHIVNFEVYRMGSIYHDGVIDGYYPY